jgi:hypothetical protein
MQNSSKNKKKMPISMIALLFCFVSFPSFVGGQEDAWRHYYTSCDGSKFFYDTQSIVRTAKTYDTTNTRRDVRARAQQRNKNSWMVKLREKTIFSRSDHELHESKVLWEIDCSAEKIHTLMRSNFHKNGTVKINGATGVWKGIDSEPQLDALYKLVCSS